MLLGPLACGLKTEGIAAAKRRTAPLGQVPQLFTVILGLFKDVRKKRFMLDVAHLVKVAVIFILKQEGLYQITTYHCKSNK